MEIVKSHYSLIMFLSVLFIAAYQFTLKHTGLSITYLLSHSCCTPGIKAHLSFSVSHQSAVKATVQATILSKGSNRKGSTFKKGQLFFGRLQFLLGYWNESLSFSLPIVHRLLSVSHHMETFFIGMNKQRKYKQKNDCQQDRSLQLLQSNLGSDTQSHLPFSGCLKLATRLSLPLTGRHQMRTLITEDMNHCKLFQKAVCHVF